MTAACTTSTRSGGSPAKRSGRCTRPAANQGEDFFVEAGDVDTAVAVLTLSGGTLALVSNTRYNPRGYDVRLELHGSRESIADFPHQQPYSTFIDRFGDAFRAELTAFTEVVAGARTSPCTVADALEASWIAEAATLSRQVGRPIDVSEVKRN